jgi:hypothetical protein
MKKIISLLIVGILLIVSFGTDAISGYIKLENNEYSLIIITPEKFSTYLQPLLEHKNSYGVDSVIKTTEQIYEEYEGRDNAEQIKYFIKYAIEQWNIDYVLLVGGRAPSIFGEKWLLPVRYSNIVDNWMIPEKRYISDLYYADIYDEFDDFSTWDTDNDSIFGEWGEDKPANDIVDIYPDVYVGRLPCRNKIEVKIMVNKIINYETGKCDESWFKNLVVVAGDTYTDNDYFEGENAALEAIDYMSSGFNPIKLFTSDGSFAGVDDVVNTINQGCGFLFFSGHGSPYSWGTNPPYNDSNLIYGLKLHHMLLLKNEEKLPICVVGGCHNSMFNISLFHQSWTYGFPAPECWSWLLTRKIGGGAIATIGCTGLGYGKEDKHNPELGGGGDYLNVLFFKEYGQNQSNTLGEVWGTAISTYLDEYPIDWNELGFSDTGLDAKTVQQWVLLGDPSLKIGGYDYS